MTGHYPGRPPIDAYGGGGFRFAGISHRGSILILPSGVYGWDGSGLAPVIAEASGIDILLYGSGKTFARPARPVREALAAAGIGLEAMDTGAAVRTWNVLLAEGRKVAAALVAVAEAR